MIQTNKNKGTFCVAKGGLCSLSAIILGWYQNSVSGRKSEGFGVNINNDNPMGPLIPEKILILP